MPAEEEYEHWPNDDRHWMEPAVAAPGYDSNNGLQRHLYRSAYGGSPSPAPDCPPQQPPQPPAQSLPPMYYPQVQHPTVTYPNMQHYPQPQYVYATPPPAYGYYTYGQPPAPVPTPQPAPAPAYMAPCHVYQPTFDEPAESRQPMHTWLGRTLSQVHEDNMNIAKREGACDKRQVEPIDVAEGQMLWVVETDGSHTLRSVRYLESDLFPSQRMFALRLLTVLILSNVILLAILLIYVFNHLD